MNKITYDLSFNGGILERGFWLYVWEITVNDKTKYYYVGRTGDSSSFNAQSPFNRMGQHLGFNEKNNVLRRHLETLGIEANKCEFRLVANGPILKSATTEDEHLKSRDAIAGLEKALADEMRRSGYNIINQIYSKHPVQIDLWNEVRAAFAENFPNIKR